MTSAIVAPDQDAIVSEIEIAAPPARVFEALTDASQLRVWFTDPSCPIHLWEMDARLGGKYRYKTEKGTAVVNNVREFECTARFSSMLPRVFSFARGSETGMTTSRPHRCALGARSHSPRHACEGHA